jgi:hypothetical protein
MTPKATFVFSCTALRTGVSESSFKKVVMRLARPVQRGRMLAWWL